MRLYEGLFLIDAGRAARDWEGAEADIVAMLEKHGASFRRKDRFDERKLAYPVEGSRRGAYLLAYLDTDPQSIDEIRQDLTLSESVLRFMFTRMAEADMPEASTLGNMEPMGAKAVVEETAAEVPTAPVAEAAPAAAAPPPAVEAAPEAEASAKEPKAEEPKAEEPKTEEPKTEEPKTEEPKVEEAPAEEPKAEAEEPTAEPEAEGKES